MFSINKCTSGFVQVFLLLGGIAFGGAAQADLASERAALMEFYNTTGGSGWPKQAGWGTGASICTWEGVICDSENTTVESLNLIANNLSGSIPPQVVNLPNLKQLFLSENNLTGTIPTQLGSLSALTRLEMYSNNLTGPIPDSLGSLSNLDTLTLFSNQLEGPIPASLGQLSKLEVLSLHKNRFSGTIPAELGKLMKLVFLTLYSNKLTGEIPGTLLPVVQQSTFHSIAMGYNAVHSNDASLLSTLMNKHVPTQDLMSTQTLDADGVVATSVGSDSVALAWNEVAPITPKGSAEGGYRIYLSTQPNSGYVLKAQIAGKDNRAATVSNLTECTVYYGQVRSYTDPHDNNQNLVESDSQTGNTVRFQTGGSCSGGGGGGGCSLRAGAAFDPMLPLMLFLAMAYLVHRSRVNRGNRH